MVAMQMKGSGGRVDRKRPSVFDDDEELKPGESQFNDLLY